jgi:hypothetical protein
MLEYILDGLFHIATADGVLHPQEEQFLGQVAKRFGFTNDEFSFMKARHAAAHERNPYAMLGVKPSVSDKELKRQYERMVAEAQPDKFVERGMPKEFVLIATARLAALKEAHALARSIESPVVSTHPDPPFSPVSTLPASIIWSCCCRLACSCLHQATKRRLHMNFAPVT